MFPGIGGFNNISLKFTFSGYEMIYVLIGYFRYSSPFFEIELVDKTIEYYKEYIKRNNPLKGSKKKSKVQEKVAKMQEKRGYSETSSVAEEKVDKKVEMSFI